MNTIIIILCDVVDNHVLLRSYLFNVSGRITLMQLVRHLYGLKLTLTVIVLCVFVDLRAGNGIIENTETAG